MEKHKVRMTLDKETKNQIRFAENETSGKPPVVGSIYLPKWVVGNNTVIDVTVEPAEDSATLPKGGKK